MQCARILFQLCPSGWFTCQSGGITCVDESLKCDCQSDCDDESDETSAYASCSATHQADCLLRASASECCSDLGT